MAAIPFPRENKFKAFFRSRSRSRSRSQPPDPPPAISDELPLPRPRHTRDVPSSSDNPPSSYLKSSVRSQNRPISSTTTATHSTITPLPSDCLRNRGRHAYAYQHHSTDTHTSLHDHDQYNPTCDYDSDDNNLPRAETPSGSSIRRKTAWHSFFGIALARKSSSTTSTPSQSTPPPDRKASTSTSASESKAKSSRKRSFRLTSRPSTPKSADSSSKSSYAIPTPSSPLPLSASPRRCSFGLGNSQRSTPKSSTSHLPLPTPQPVRSHGRRHSVGSERPPHDSAVALPEEPSHRPVHKPAPDCRSRNKGKEKENHFVEPERPLNDLIPSFDFPSQLDPSRTHLSPHLPRHPAFSNLPTVDSASSEENDQSSHRLHVIPQIIHTPPTPQRPGEEVDSPPRPGTSPSSGNNRPAKGKTVTIARREQLLVLSSQPHADAQHAPSPKGRFTPRFLSTKDAPKAKDSNGQKSTRRPPAVSYDGPTHKTGSARNMTSHRGKLGSFDFERPVSAVNRSSSTVDQQKTLDNSSYSKAHLPSLERTISNDSARVGRFPLIAAQAGLPLSQLKQDHTGSTSVISFSSVSLQTKSTGKDTGSNTPAGQSSSWGRASGRRVLRGSHGTFAFEQPSSLPNSPNPHTFNLPNEPSRDQITGLPQSQPTTPLHAIFDARGKHSRGQSYNASDDPTPGGRKSKGRGRSFDLGLGLSWAPSRLREEVLMPGSILTREKAKQRANGVDVTRTFESILSESQFQTFKKHVRRFDAHTIPLEGPSGLLARVENLLAESGLSERERSKLMTDFSVFAENHSG